MTENQLEFIATLARDVLGQYLTDDLAYRISVEIMEKIRANKVVLEDIGDE